MIMAQEQALRKLDDEHSVKIEILRLRAKSFAAMIRGLNAAKYGQNSAALF